MHISHPYHFNLFSVLLSVFYPSVRFSPLNLFYYLRLCFFVHELHVILVQLVIYIDSHNIKCLWHIVISSTHKATHMCLSSRMSQVAKPAICSYWCWGQFSYQFKIMPGDKSAIYSSWPWVTARLSNQDNAEWQSGYQIKITQSGKSAIYSN